MLTVRPSSFPSPLVKLDVRISASSLPAGFTSTGNGAHRGAVIGSAFEVANVLGAGFLEKIFERAMILELRLRGLAAKSQV
ncbi:hypothetical protein SBA3_950003 [Candidatus Sulfopaludibacter sp. SbA3]|nr:hypothetical protein SBA3_950003 [Candidatus Sulfopaludibacter sp. SbA3]